MKRQQWLLGSNFFPVYSSEDTLIVSIYPSRSTSALFASPKTFTARLVNRWPPLDGKQPTTHVPLHKISQTYLSTILGMEISQKEKVFLYPGTMKSWKNICLGGEFFFRGNLLSISFPCSFYRLLGFLPLVCSRRSSSFSRLVLLSCSYLCSISRFCGHIRKEEIFTKPLRSAHMTWRNECVAFNLMRGRYYAIPGPNIQRTHNL